MSQIAAMKAQIVDQIVKDIDPCYKLYSALVFERKLDFIDCLINFMFNSVGESDYVPNQYVYEQLDITLPTDKNQYYKVITKVKNHYAVDEYFDFDVDFNDMCQHSEQLSHLYGRMMFDECKKEAFEKYVRVSNNWRNVSCIKDELKLIINFESTLLNMLICKKTLHDADSYIVLMNNKADRARPARTRGFERALTEASQAVDDALKASKESDIIALNANGEMCRTKCV